MSDSATLVLASGSRTRADMLRHAGVAHRMDPPGLDEAALKRNLVGLTAPQIAAALAEAKARVVSLRHSGALVLGADQTLECEGRLYDKPAVIEAARAQLASLAGQEHRLHSAAAIVLDGQVVWQANDHATLHMRALSAGFIDSYLGTAGDAVRHSVGAYQLEGLGAQLFT